MLKIVKHPTFRTTATIMVPTDEGPQPQTLRVRFKLMDDDQYPENEDKGLGFLREAVLSVEDVVDEDDKPIPYDDALRDELFKRAYIRLGLLQAYFAGATGFAAATRGN